MNRNKDKKGLFENSILTILILFLIDMVLRFLIFVISKVRKGLDKRTVKMK